MTRGSGPRSQRQETSRNSLIARLIPSRLASLALGTGDLDTVYHFALPELIEAVAATGKMRRRPCSPCCSAVSVYATLATCRSTWRSSGKNQTPQHFMA